MKLQSVNTPGKSPLRFLFILLSSILALGFIIYALSTWEKARQDTSIELAHLNRLLTQTTHEVLNHYETVLRILGERLLESGADQNPENGRALLETLIRINTGLAGYGLARPDGQLMIVSGVPEGENLPNLMEQQASAETFQLALKSKRLVVGRTYYFPLLQHWVIPIRIAIEDTDKKHSLVMASGLIPESPEHPWNAIETPRHVQLSIVRGDHYYQLLKSSETGDKESVYTHPLPPACFADIKQAASSRLMINSVACHELIRSIYLPEYDLYTVVTQSPARLWLAWKELMIWPSVLFFMMLGGALVLYKIALRMEQHLAEERLNYEEHLIHQANHDALTGLPNRLLVMDRLEQVIHLAKRQNTQAGLFFLDLDNFKRINDSLGHIMGDKLLKLAAERLTNTLREVDTVARLGGDEFLVLVYDLKDKATIQILAEKILNAFSLPFHLKNRTLYTTTSIGIALYPGDAEDAHGLLQAADTAMYQAKNAGRNTLRFYSTEMNVQSQRRMHLENHLRQAIERNELSVHYQPQLRISDQGVKGVEALLRWHNPEFGQVPPIEFISIAEETGLISSLSDFVLRTALREIAQLENELGIRITLAINASAVQLQNSEFPIHVQNILDEQERPAEYLQVEITESVMVDQMNQTLKCMHRLRDMQVRIAIDDFGTGYSSLSYLSKMPIHTLKIDRSFIKNIKDSPNNTLLTRTIIAMGISMDLEVVAEGVETAEDLQFLRQNACDLAQGYYFARPMPAQELREFLIRHSFS
jgi:diguanylate cyclase